MRAKALMGLACLLVGCGIPRDAQRTSEHVEQTKRIRVGLSENPPWIIRQGREPGGIEADLVRQFAARLNATPEWHWGGEQAHMEALERFELDLVVGGLTSKTPWKKTIGMSDTFYGRHIFAAPPGENGWIKRLDEFLSSRRDQIKQAAQAANAP
jgi:polar amino acid transport system substrate-binding protein